MISRSITFPRVFVRKWTYYGDWNSNLLTVIPQSISLNITPRRHLLFKMMIILSLEERKKSHGARFVKLFSDGDVLYFIFYFFSGEAARNRWMLRSTCSVIFRQGETFMDNIPNTYLSMFSWLRLIWTLNRWLSNSTCHTRWTLTSFPLGSRLLPFCAPV